MLICLSSADFTQTFNDIAAAVPPDAAGNPKSAFPTERFLKGGQVITQEPWPKRIFREDDLEAGLTVPRGGFGIMLTSRFKPEEFEGYLFGNPWGLPKPTDTYQVIQICYEEDVKLL